MILTASFEQYALVATGVILIVGLTALVRLRRQVAELKQQGREQRRQVADLQQNQQAMNHSVVGMGRKIRSLTQRLGEAEQRSLFTPGDEASYQQAARLVSLGASARELVENCGMARAEAELLLSLKGGRQQRH